MIIFTKVYHKCLFLVMFNLDINNKLYLNQSILINLQLFNNYIIFSRYIFIRIQKDFIQAVRFNFKNSYYLEWKVSRSFKVQVFTGSPHHGPGKGHKSFPNSKKCPSGFKLISQVCYKAVLKKLYWKDAQKNCMKKGAYLATIQSQVQFNAADFMFKNHHKKCFTPSHGSNYWIGGARCNGKIMWLTKGSPCNFVPSQRNCPKGALRQSWSKYTPLNPSNSGGNEHCLEMLLDHGWGMNDLPCHYRGMCSLCQTYPK